MRKYDGNVWGKKQTGNIKEFQNDHYVELVSMFRTFHLFMTGN